LGRQRAAEDLARLCQSGTRDERMLPSLVAALNDNDASVRSAAANALLQLGSPEAIAPLKRRLESEESIHVRASLQRAIERLQA
jgi:HEAT repeat protein